MNGKLFGGDAHALLRGGLALTGDGDGLALVS